MSTTEILCDDEEEVMIKGVYAVLFTRQLKKAVNFQQMKFTKGIA
jgi:hypothetical protein